MGISVQTHLAISLSVFPLVALLVGRALIVMSAECQNMGVVEHQLALGLRLAVAVPIPLGRVLLVLDTVRVSESAHLES